MLDKNTFHKEIRKLKLPMTDVNENIIPANTHARCQVSGRSLQETNLCFSQRHNIHFYNIPVTSPLLIKKKPAQRSRYGLNGPGFEKP